MAGTRPSNWIAVDWGTSSLRAWLMSERAVVAEAGSEQGMGRLAPEAFEAALLEVIAPWLDGLQDGPATVMACGMVGARQGWTEAAYAPVPCPAAPDHTGLTRAPTTDPRLAVWIAPGVSQAAPPDVMRGEETQIAGFLAANPRFDGVACLPGTHTKWAHISAEEIVSFRTFMSGEIFALLSTQSVLRHAVAPGPGTGTDTGTGTGTGTGWDDAAFAEAVSETLSRPERLAAALFGLRAASLLTEQPGGTARARLSGLLIGAELAAAKPYWLGQPVALIGAPGLTAHYATALAAQGLTPTQHDAAAMTRAGLAALYETVTP